MYFHRELREFSECREKNLKIRFFRAFRVSSQKFGVGARLALAQLGDRKGAPLHIEMIPFRVEKMIV